MENKSFRNFKIRQNDGPSAQETTAKFLLIGGFLAVVTMILLDIPPILYWLDALLSKLTGWE